SGQTCTPSALSAWACLSSQASVFCAARDPGEPRDAARSLRRNNRAFGSLPYQVEPPPITCSVSFKIRFNLFQRLALGLRQEPGCGHEINDGERSKAKEHGRRAVRADRRQEHRTNRRRPG